MGEAREIKFESVFAQASFQFCGHVDEYLIRHTRHLGLFYNQTRFGKGGHLLRIYESGKLVEERRFSSARSIPLYYWRMWWNWHRELCRFSRSHKDVTAIFEFPSLAAGRWFRRKVRHVFWQWDYFPGRGFTERLYDAVAWHYARKCERYIPLTSSIGRVMGMSDVQPLMLGVTPPTRFGDPRSSRILMVGQLRGGQGIENVLDFIASHPQYSLSLMGAAAHGFEKVIEERIAVAKMADRIYFPNHFVSDAELREEAAKCFVSLALYDMAPSNLTHYADPGKVKSSIEMGLPVIMTRISDIVPFIKKFKAGEVIDSVDDLAAAIDCVRGNYAEYQQGLRAFAGHFDCERYYADALISADCQYSGNLILSPHAEESDDKPNDQRSVCGGVYSFAAARELAMADLGRVRVLAKELSAELMRTVQHGSGASVRETSVALVAVAKRHGRVCFMDPLIRLKCAAVEVIETLHELGEGRR